MIYIGYGAVEWDESLHECFYITGMFVHCNVCVGVECESRCCRDCVALAYCEISVVNMGIVRKEW